MSKKITPRKELDAYVGRGNLRDAIDRYNCVQRLSPAAIELLINVVGRYCAPRRNSALRAGEQK